MRLALSSIRPSILALCLALPLGACAGKTPAPEPASEASAPAPAAPESSAPAAESALPAPATVNLELAPHFRGYPGTFVVQGAADAPLKVYNPARAEEGFIPASTFKIPSTLIALQTGVASGPDFTLAYDPITTPPTGFWPNNWSQDHTLTSALQNSVVWYYQELARRIGEARMAEYVDAFDYGNGDIGGALDGFWLNGDLRISAHQQVDFLRRVYEGRLGLEPEHTQALKGMMLLEETPTYRISGKTGTAVFEGDMGLSWLVGWVEVGGDVSYYALNVEGDNIWDVWSRPERVVLAKALLTEAGVLPTESGGMPEDGGMKDAAPASGTP